MSNLPEENVRSQLIERLQHTFGFPKQLLVREKALHQLPHLLGRENIPTNRRIDLIAYHWSDGDLKPLVLFECKFRRPTSHAFQQVVGYNHWVQAPYVALVSQEHVGLFQIHAGKFTPLGGMRSYEVLCQSYNR